MVLAMATTVSSVNKELNNLASHGLHMPNVAFWDFDDFIGAVSNSRFI